jgi:hypothetical protein
MKISKIAMGIGLSLISAAQTYAEGYPTPTNVKDFYMEMYPQTARIETVGETEVAGNKYYIIWGSTEYYPERPDDTEATLMVASNGAISRINGDVPSALPFWYIKDKRVWNPLLQSFIDYQIKSMGETGLQSDISSRQFIAQPLAEAYMQRGFKIARDTKLLTNAKGDFIEQDNNKTTIETNAEEAPKRKTLKDSSLNEENEINSSQSLEWE